MAPWGEGVAITPCPWAPAAAPSSPRIDVIATMPMHRQEDVILLNMMDGEYRFPLNLFECSDPNNLNEVAKTASMVMHIFEKA